MALPIYDTIRNFYGGSSSIPKNDAAAPFFGFSGCTRTVLEDVLAALRADNSWIGQTAAARSSFFSRVAWDFSASTGADYDGLLRWCNYVFVASQGDKAVLDWLGGAAFDTFAYYAKVIKEGVSETAQQVAENIEYGLKYESPAQKTFFNTILPVAAILGTCYLVKKVLD